MHQHTPLYEVLRRLKDDGGAIVERYLRYKAHVCRQVYADPEGADRALPSIEAAWPEYADSAVLMSRPAYLSGQVGESDHPVLPSVQEDPASEESSSAIAEGRQWLGQYLNVHVQAVQERTQHHVHLPNPETGER